MGPEDSRTKKNDFKERVCARQETLPLAQQVLPYRADEYVVVNSGGEEMSLSPMVCDISRSQTRSKCCSPQKGTYPGSTFGSIP